MKMKEFNKKVITLVLIITFVFSPVFARKAEAQWVDWANLVPNILTAIADYSSMLKEYGLDTVAGQMVNLVIEKMSASTINWINRGFKGSPAFVTNPEAYFLDIGDKMAGQYIFRNPNLNFLCGPISAKIRLALTQNYLQERQWECTLTQVGKNMDNFMSNFENGGWDSFFEVSQRQQNNPIGAYLQAENELNLQIATRQETKERELNWGKGFMSFQKCKGASSDSSSDVGYVEGQGYVTSSESLSSTDCETVTPGSVIADQLGNTLKIPLDKLAAADEINEMISALMTQLTKQIVGGVGRGLRGLSKPSSTGGQTFTSQLSTPEKDTKADTYFASTASSSEDLLNAPTPDPAICQREPDNEQCRPPAGSQNARDYECQKNPDGPGCRPN